METRHVKSLSTSTYPESPKQSSPKNIKTHGLKLNMNLIENVYEKLPKSSERPEITNNKADYPLFYTPANSRMDERRSMLDHFRNSAKRSIMGSLLSSRCSSKNSLNTDDSISDAKQEQLSLPGDIEGSFEVSPPIQRKKLNHLKFIEALPNYKHKPIIIPNLIKPEPISMINEEDKALKSLATQSNCDNFQNQGIANSSEKIFYENDDEYNSDREEGFEMDSNINIIKGGFNKLFEELLVLGQGTSATVKKCKKISTGELFAVKIHNYRGDEERLHISKKEFSKHHQLNHKNIVKVYELYIDTLNKKVYTIMELVQGKELSEYIESNGIFSEKEASSIFRQILLALHYLHAKGVCHRDIKPDNLLISEDGKIVKITDFGVSKFCTNHDQIKNYSSLSKKNYSMMTRTGTKSFSPPEYFIDTEYAELFDVWSAGVTLCIMLTGVHPFEAEYLDDQIKKIVEAEYDLDTEIWKNISSEGKDLIKCCLRKDYNLRYTPSQALMHSWISKWVNESNEDIINSIINGEEDANKERHSSLKDSFLREHISISEDLSPTIIPLKKNSSISMSCCNKAKRFIIEDKINSLL